MAAKTMKGWAKEKVGVGLDEVTPVTYVMWHA